MVDNTKVMSRSHQGHFKVKIAIFFENTHFNFKQFSGAVIH